MPAGVGGATGTLGGAAASAAVGRTAAVTDCVLTPTPDRAAEVCGVVVNAEGSRDCAVVPTVTVCGKDPGLGAVEPAVDVSAPPPLAGVKYPLPALEWLRVARLSAPLVPLPEAPVPLEEPP